jgi:hypothetical protein
MIITVIPDKANTSAEASELLWGLPHGVWYVVSVKSKVVLPFISFTTTLLFP